MTAQGADWMEGPGCPDCGSHAWRTKVLPKEVLVAQGLCTNACHNPPQPAQCDHGLEPPYTRTCDECGPDKPVQPAPAGFEEAIAGAFRRLLKHDLCPDTTGHGPCDRCYDVRRLQHLVSTGLHAVADCRLAWERRDAAHAKEVEEAVQKERNDQVWRAHVPVTNEQHDPQRGLLSGFCERCRAPWPCDYSPEPSHSLLAESRAAGKREQAQETLNYIGTGRLERVNCLTLREWLAERAVEKKV